MVFKVGVGKSDFAELRKSGNYYVDKTKLIYEQILCYGVAFFKNRLK